MIIENEKRKMAAQAGSGFGDSGSSSDADPGSEMCIRDRPYRNYYSSTWRRSTERKRPYGSIIWSIFW